MANPEGNNPLSAILAKFKEAADKRKKAAQLAAEKKARVAREAKREKAAIPKNPAQKVEINPEEAQLKPKEALKQYMEDNPQIREALGGKMPDDDDVTRLLMQWASASEEVRGKAEVVKAVVEELEAIAKAKTEAKIPNPNAAKESRDFKQQFEKHFFDDLRKLESHPQMSEENYKTNYEKELERMLRNEIDPNLDAEFKKKGEEIRQRASEVWTNEKTGQGRPLDYKQQAKLGDELLEIAREKGIPQSEVEPYMHLLSSAVSENTSEVSGRVRWSEVPDWPIEKGRRREPGDKIFQFRFLTQDDANKFQGDGLNGENEWFWEIIRTKESMPRQEMQLTFVEWQKMDEFWNYLTWKYGGKEAIDRKIAYQKHLDVRPGLHHRLRLLVHEPVNEENALKALTVSPDEYSYLMKINPLAPRATALYEEATRNLMMQKKLRRNELLNGNPKKGILKKADRDARITVLKGKLGNMSVTERAEFFELYKQKTEYDEGVMLWSNDVQFDAETWLVLQQRKAKQESLMSRLQVEKNPGEREKLLKELDEVLLTEHEQKTLKYRGKSPLDLETERLLRLDMMRRGKKEFTKLDDLDIEMAVYAARTYEIVTLNLMQLAIRLAENPVPVKSRYRAHAFERLGRIISPELFQRRFQFGGKIGFRKQAYHAVEMMKTKKISLHDKDIKKAYDKHRSFLAQMAKNDKENYGQYEDKYVLHAEALIKAAEDVKHISYDEMNRIGTILIGGPFQVSTWRMETSGFDPVVDKFQAMGKTMEHSALGFQLAADPLKRGKDKIMSEMFERMPWLVAQYAPNDFEKILAAHPRVNGQVLQDTLLTAQIGISHNSDKRYANRRINLADEADFNEFVKPVLNDMANKDKGMVADPEVQKQLSESSVQDEYKAVIREMVDQGRENVEHWGERNKDNKFDLKVGMTMTYSDMDLGDEEFYRMGEQAMQRRFEGDMAQAFQVMQVQNALQGGKPDMISPNDPVKVLEEIAKLIGAQDAYMGRDMAELSGKNEIVELFLFNEWKNRGILEWFPGSEWLIRNAVPRKWQTRTMSSDSVEFEGLHGNMYDENTMFEILNSARKLDFFVQHPEYYDEIVEQFHLGLSNRLLAAVRKYWWVLPGIVGFTSGKKATEEDEKT